MISSIETDLARRDRSIPGLALVLDPEAFVTELRRAVPQADLRSARINYVEYSPRDYCRVAYRLELGGIEVDAGVRACRPENLAEWTTDPEGLDARGGWKPGSVVLRPCAVVVTTLPVDLRLAGLRGLGSGAERRQLLSELLPHQPEFWQADLRCLRYRPDRRYVAELFAHGKRVLLKAYAQKSYARGKCNATAFQSDGPLRLARLLGCSDRRGLLAFEWLPGRLLADLVTGGDTDCTMLAAVGAALATIHNQNAERLHERPREVQVRDLCSVAAEVGFVFPELARRAEGLARRLGRHLMDAPPLNCPLHGDFSSKQVLVDRHYTAVIDFDLARRGDPAEDLGNFIAQAERYALSGELPMDRVEWLRNTLLEGYCRATKRPPPARIGLHTAVRLFRRARHPFRHRETDCLQRTESLLNRAEEILDRATSERLYGKIGDLERASR